MRTPLLPPLLLLLCAAVAAAASPRVSSAASTPPSFAGVRAAAAASAAVASATPGGGWQWHSEWIDAAAARSSPRASPSWLMDSRASSELDFDMTELFDDAAADSAQWALQLQQEEEERPGGPGRRGSRRRMRYCEQWQCAGTAVEDRQWCIDRCVFSWELEGSDAAHSALSDSSADSMHSNHTGRSLKQEEADDFDTAASCPGGRWYGTAPFCDPGSCPGDTYLSFKSRTGDGARCLSGYKFCCKPTYRRPPPPPAGRFDPTRTPPPVINCPQRKDCDSCVGGGLDTVGDRCVWCVESTRSRWPPRRRLTEDCMAARASSYGCSGMLITAANRRQQGKAAFCPEPTVH